ncbi:diacylglycerol lipase-alpha isoform X2 [Hyalella azteca]|uniref:Diacylglycerol lipase-alpha n=1 Tax=Hyalella azteca TaxID=294128 RepID=A0A979FUJ1_HYAAZ|nr:diacylglycerol lipase-alpha isoform X2 [Hyalella azteca]
MPGIVVFRRRWSVGSDDLVVPGIFLLIMHTIWLVVVSVIYGVMGGGKDVSGCWGELKEHLIGYFVLLSSCIIVEAFIAYVAMRGTILDPEPRASMQYLLYVRLVLLTGELVWVILGVVWLARHYQACTHNRARDVILGIVVCNWCVLLSVFLTVCCTFDAAGRSWVKMKRYQRSTRHFPAKRTDSGQDVKTKRSRCTSGNANRNWRHRKVMKAYQDSWDQRCRLLFCCINTSDSYRNSFGDIARLLSEFFRDLDVVPSDVVAGLVLLRKCQKMERKAIVKNPKTDVRQFLSGVPITANTRFLQLNTPEGDAEFRKILHYMRFALAVYGWLMYVMRASTTKAACQLCPELRCWSCAQSASPDAPHVVEDNCCMCNTAALFKMAPAEDLDLVYATFHVDIGETPFFVALDHSRKAVVISIRGTLSMKDMITDLNAESEPLPMDTVKDDWLGHKGMVQAAVYIRTKLREEQLLEKAFARDPDRGTDRYDLVLVGHSLGAGTAAILAILLKQQYANLCCFAYSPPGGLLSKPVLEYTKAFITSVVVGKDVVPRIGLHQMETLRADLITAIQHSQDPKWKTIASTMQCCGSGAPPVIEDEAEGPAEQWSSSRRKLSRNPASHPSDATIELTVHRPLYPPGRILHVVRHHPGPGPRWRRSGKPVYQAVWVDNEDFGEVIISPCMIQDHMPDKVLEALELVLENPGPAKPQRKQSTPDDTWRTSRACRDLRPCASTAQSPQSPLSQDQPVLSHSVSQPLSQAYIQTQNGLKLSNTPPHKLQLETSFTCSPVTSPNQRPDLRVHALAHALSWELVSALEEQLLASGFPAGYQIGCPELPSGPWTGHAPLASPETLSDASSISSRLSVALKEIWNNNSKTPSPPTSLTGSKSKQVDGAMMTVVNEDSSLPLVTSSPKIAPKTKSAPLGQGYCFYIDAPPSHESDVNMVHPPLATPTPDQVRRFSPSPPPQYISISPILPSYCDKADTKEQDKIKETLDELFRSIDKPPFVIDLEDERNPHEMLTPTSMTHSKEMQSDQFDCSSVEGFLDDDVKIYGSRGSSLSLTRGKTESQDLTTSVMSRDSGYVERGTSGRQSNGTLADGTEESEVGVGEVLLEFKTWGDTQQEYGRGSGPPNLPHYAYNGTSQEHLAADHDPDDSVTFCENEIAINQKIDTRDHPHNGETPLLHAIKNKRKDVETSL